MSWKPKVKKEDIFESSSSCRSQLGSFGTDLGTLAKEVSTEARVLACGTATEAVKVGDIM